MGVITIVKGFKYNPQGKYMGAIIRVNNQRVAF